MANDFGTGKSFLVLAIVAGCFAILWPNVFYPMITGSYTDKDDGYSGGCCDVIFDNDINAIKIMAELCEKILFSENKLDNKSLLSFQQGKLTKEILESCQKSVLEKCDLNITDLLIRKVMLGKDYRQNLDLVRTLNSSICLRESFGISLGQIGLPRRMRVWGVNMSSKSFVFYGVQKQ